MSISNLILHQIHPYLLPKAMNDSHPFDISKPPVSKYS